MASYAMSSEQAQSYLIDPLNAPQPIDETGLNTTFRSTFAARPPSEKSSAKPVTGTLSQSTSAPSKRHSRAPSGSSTATRTRSRGNSLGQRHPGDMTHQPLDMLKKERKAADRSHHLRKTSIPGVDTIDSLDATPNGRYHHEGPYDATLLSRNLNPVYSPVAAVAESNAQALRATPVEKIKDALERHKPLDGVATYPPGQMDPSGRRFDYEETNLVIEGGDDYKTLSGQNYDDEKKDDLSANHTYELGAPSHRKTTAIELQDNPNHSHDTKQSRGKKSVEIREDDFEEEENRSKKSPLGSLKKRIGSLRRKND